MKLHRIMVCVLAVTGSQFSVMRVGARFGILAPLLFLLVGCGGGEDVPPTFPTQGKLTVNGEPAKGAVVSLHPVTGNFDRRGSRPVAHVKADGSFTFTTFGSDDGVPAGDYKVAIVWPMRPGAMEPSPDRLLNRYANPKESPLEVTIKEGENQLAAFELDDVKVREESDSKEMTPEDRLYK